MCLAGGGGIDKAGPVGFGPRSGLVRGSGWIFNGRISGLLSISSVMDPYGCRVGSSE
jgi:hypothetical protein